jgi:hypothetical protein
MGSRQVRPDFGLARFEDHLQEIGNERAAHYLRVMAVGMNYQMIHARDINDLDDVLSRLDVQGNRPSFNALPSCTRIVSPPRRALGLCGTFWTSETLEDGEMPWTILNQNHGSGWKARGNEWIETDGEEQRDGSDGNNARHGSEYLPCPTLPLMTNQRLSRSTGTQLVR